ncbi:MAG: hypothetical protein ACI8W8_002052 [Rhodothermales bacterium]|jgi:hypothetical protein
MRFPLLILAFTLLSGASPADRVFQPNGQASARWDFAESADRAQWRVLGNLEIQPGANGALFVGTGNDPIAETRLPTPIAGPAVVWLRCRAERNISTQFFWAGPEQGYAEARAISQTIHKSEAMHTHSFMVDQGQVVAKLRFDPMPGKGRLQVASILVQAASQPISQPYPRTLYTGEVLHTFATDQPNPGVAVAGTAEAEPAEGQLKLRVTGTDPQILLSGFPRVKESLCLRFRARLTGGGMGVLYWGDAKTPGYSPERQIEFLTEYDDEWHEHTIPIPSDNPLTDLRLDLGSERGGIFWIADLALVRGGLHPLEITAVSPQSSTVQNHSNDPLSVRFRDRELRIAAKSTAELFHPLAADKAVQAIDLHLETEGFPAITRQLWVHSAQEVAPSLRLERGELRLELAQDGSYARIFRGGHLQAVMAPLALLDGRLPKWTAHRDGSVLKLAGEASASIRFAGDDVLLIQASANAELELVVRALGGLEQAVLPGLEYLGKAESSSSRLDFATIQHFRFMPKADQLTWPALLMATDQQSISLTWEETGARPSFASPNFVDGTADHRMSLKGRKIRARLRLSAPEPISTSILQAVRDIGLPAATRPRSESEQAALSRKAFDGPLRSADGWGHCVEENYTRRWYADLASGFWDLGGDLATLPKLVPGGGHIRDSRSLFLTGQAELWLQMQRGEIQPALRDMQPDGSFRYEGRFRKGHFEDTASGYCGKRAATLLTYAERTGDAAAREVGLKALEFIRRFRTPRGAQTWELSLHTPDILAAAHLVEAYVIGYLLTGDPAHLAEARKWAASGLPFVYLRGDKPTDIYATVPVFGASSWVAPNWLGKPVQWNGLVYAHAIARLADVDDSFPWRQVAQGIVIAAEHMQEPDGSRVGCLPDYWFRASNRGGGPAINPTVIMSAANRAWSRAAGLQTARHNGQHVTGPFPFDVQDGQLYVISRSGTPYQLVINDTRILFITGTGKDKVALPQ